MINYFSQKPLCAKALPCMPSILNQSALDDNNNITHNNTNENNACRINYCKCSLTETKELLNNINDEKHT